MYPLPGETKTEGPLWLTGQPSQISILYAQWQIFMSENKVDIKEDTVDLWPPHTGHTLTYTSTQHTQVRAHTYITTTRTHTRKFWHTLYDTDDLCEHTRSKITWSSWFIDATFLLFVNEFKGTNAGFQLHEVLSATKSTESENRELSPALVGEEGCIRVEGGRVSVFHSESDLETGMWWQLHDGVKYTQCCKQKMVGTVNFVLLTTIL